jgi:hypothetical protein
MEIDDSGNVTINNLDGSGCANIHTDLNGTLSCENDEIDDLVSSLELDGLDILCDTEDDRILKRVGGMWTCVEPTDTVTGTGLANKVAYFTDVSVLSYDDNLHWDDTNNRLGIATTTPKYDLVVEGDISADRIRMNNNDLSALSTADGTHLQVGSQAAGSKLGLQSGDLDDALVVNTSGAVGVGGETNPDAPLNIGDTFGSTYLNFKQGLTEAALLGNLIGGPDVWLTSSAGNIILSQAAGAETWVFNNWGYVFLEYESSPSRGRIGAYKNPSWRNLTLNEGGANVSIGTDASYEKLTVSGNVGASSFNLVNNTNYKWVPGSGGYNDFHTEYGYIRLGPNSAGYTRIEAGDSSMPIMFNTDVYSYIGIFGSYNNDLLLKTQNTIGMRIDSATGAVGLGTASALNPPSELFHLKSDSSFRAYIQNNNALSWAGIRTSNGAKEWFYGVNGVSGDFQIVSNSDSNNVLEVDGDYGSVRFVPTDNMSSFSQYGSSWRFMRTISSGGVYCNSASEAGSFKIYTNNSGNDELCVCLELGSGYESYCIYAFP